MLKYFDDNQPAGEINPKETILLIAKAMKYLHDQFISNGDLKLSNILLDDQNHPKICDFGLSHIGLSKISSRNGTSHYQGPEFFTESKIDPFKADIYSFGILSYAILEFDFPFMDSNDEKLIILMPEKNIHSHLLTKILDIIHSKMMAFPC